MSRARVSGVLLSMLFFACGEDLVKVDSGSGGGGGGGDGGGGKGGGGGGATSSSAGSSQASSASSGGSGGGGGESSACPYLEDCKAGCESAIPQQFPPDAACTPEDFLNQCIGECCLATKDLEPKCAACVAKTIAIQISDDTCGAIAGIFLDCAVSACDVVYPCSDPTCNADSHCVRPCPPAMGLNWGTCSFVGSGTCFCGEFLQDDCIAPATCICPACGEGEGICVTPKQKESLCFDYMVSPLKQATDHFACPP